VPVREEHLLARAHHAPVYGQLRKTHLVTTESEDDDEDPGGVLDIYRTTGNHRSSFKKQPENQA
jgi:hypothetical protein